MHIMSHNTCVYSLNYLWKVGQQICLAWKYQMTPIRASPIHWRVAWLIYVLMQICVLIDLLI